MEADERMDENKKDALKISRNAPCPCGSGKKYKLCCGAKVDAAERDEAAQASRFWVPDGVMAEKDEQPDDWICDRSRWRGRSRQTRVEMSMLNSYWEKMRSFAGRSRESVSRFFGGWIIPVLLVLPTAGCFTACSRFMGNRPSTPEAIACGALDVVTLPVSVDAEYDEFAKALPVRGERIVVDSWEYRFRDTAKPLPLENVRKLAEILTEPGEPLNMCCGTLFKRPELTEDDLRGLYARILKKLEEDGEWQQNGWLYVGALIKNPRFPADLSRASYEEPLLSELRVLF